MWICENCGKMMASRTNLYRHQRNIHKLNIRLRPSRIKSSKSKAAVKRFSCDKCSCAFSRPYNVHMHQINVHKLELDNNFICSKCNTGFYFRMQMIKHLKSSGCGIENIIIPVEPVQLLDKLPEGYEYIVDSFKPNTSDSFSATFSFVISELNECHEWIENFQYKNQERYRTEYTRKKNKTISFDKCYACVHGIKGRIYSEGARSRIKRTNCKAKIYLKARKRENEIMQADVLINYNHNHNTRSIDALKHCRISKNVKIEFLELFKGGHSPTKARSMYKQNLRNEFGDKYDEIASDVSLMPNVQWVFQLYYREFKNKYADGYRSELLSQLEVAVNSYNMNNPGCASLMFINEHFILVICTPLMKRISYNIEQSKEIMYIDSTGTVNRFGCHVYIMMTNSCMGGLPMAVMIASCETSEIISCGLMEYRKIMKIDGPTVIMTNDSQAERHALQIAFPESVILLSSFHVLQDVWRYIYNSNSKISANERQFIYIKFRNLVYSQTSEEFETDYTAMKADRIISKYNNYLKYIDKYYKRKEEWALTFRQKGRRTDNINESTFHVLKDRILDRLKAYNCIQLFDILVTELDEAYENKIRDVVNDRPLNYIMTKIEKLESDLEFLSITKELGCQFTVYNEKMKHSYIADTEIVLCTCPVGITGWLCKHQYFVAESNGLHPPTMLPISQWENENLFYIANGHHNIPGNSYTGRKIEILDGDRSSPALPEIFHSSVVNQSSIAIEGEYLNMDSILKEFQWMNEDIQNRVTKNPGLLRGLQIMVKNYERFAQTDNSLESGFHTFCKYTELEVDQYNELEIGQYTNGM